MAKKIKTKIKLQIQAGKANPAPPVGPALGQHGLQIMDFCNKFNTVTKEKGDTILPVVITVYEDKTYDFIVKAPPASELLKKASGISKGSEKPNKEKIGKITKSKLEEITKVKMPDLNAYDLESGMKIIAGTAKQMGIEIIEG